MLVPEDTSAALADLGIDDPTSSSLSRFVDLLTETNRKFNLTAIRDREEVWSRHILDSLRLLPHLPADATSLLDVGSGGGLPGLPIAIARPDLAVTLLEATKKKARFLDEARATLDLSAVAVVNARAEDLDRRHRNRFDVVTARAVAPLPVLLELTIPFTRIGGVVLAMKGTRVDEEVQRCDRALRELRIDEPLAVTPLCDAPDSGVLVRVTKTRSTPRRYPRPSGRPAHDPL